MKVQTYILGFLIRYGPQHGYRLKQQLAESAADFAQIKLPTIYYHLDKMKDRGLVSVYEEREGNKPERSVYSITEAGKGEFARLLNDMLNTSFRPEFELDAVLYFADFLDIGVITTALSAQQKYLETAIDHIQEHQVLTLAQLTGEARLMADIIFKHHLIHYQTELEWLKSVGKVFEFKGRQ